MSNRFDNSRVSHDQCASFFQSSSTTSQLNSRIRVPHRFPLSNGLYRFFGVVRRTACLSFCAVLLSSLTATPFATGQAATTSPVRPPNRDASAVAVANNCVAALGGSTLLHAVESWTADGTYISPDSAGPIHWEATSNEFRLEHGEGSRASIVTSGSGHVVNKLPSTAIKIPYHMWRAWIMPIRLGTLLEADIQSKSVSIEKFPQDNDEQATVLKIIDHDSHIDETVTEQLWYIDKTTFLPRKIMYHPSRLSRPDASIWETWNLSNYRNIDGALVPFTLSRSLGNSILESITLTSAKLNLPLTSANFVSPEVSK